MAYKYIDISTFQGKPDFEKVKDHVDGVIIRAGYGQGNHDVQFERNISECNRLGIPCGVYWFSYAYSEEMARKEAEYCLKAIKPYRVELPVCFDFEYDSVAKSKVIINKTLATKLVHAFCGTIEAAGYYAMNYTNGDYLSRYFDESTMRYDLWYAAWPSNPDPAKPPRECGIWQYTSKGSVPGISGNVDMDYAYKDYPAIIKAAGLNNLTKAEAPKKDEPWYAEAQRWAVEHGIADGERPEEAATRAEVWTMLQRLAARE